jgi:hypothetical protein
VCHPPAASREIINNEIEEALSVRNAGVRVDQQIFYQPLFSFEYADGAKMITVGGILHSKEQAQALKDCGFDELPYCVKSNQPYRIPAPKLTLKERRHLDLQLPTEDIGQIVSHGLSSTVLKQYRKVYRYFPHFSEVDI